MVASGKRFGDAAGSGRFAGFFRNTPLQVERFRDRSVGVTSQRQCLNVKKSVWLRHTAWAPGVEKRQFGFQAQKSYFACRRQVIPCIAVSHISGLKFKQFQLFLFLNFFRFQRLTFLLFHYVPRERPYLSHVSKRSFQVSRNRRVLVISYDYAVAVGVLPSVPQSTTNSVRHVAGQAGVAVATTYYTHHELRRKTNTAHR